MQKDISNVFLSLLHNHCFFIESNDNRVTGFRVNRDTTRKTLNHTNGDGNGLKNPLDVSFLAGFWTSSDFSGLFDGAAAGLELISQSE